MVELDVVAVYAAPVLVVFVIGHFLYTFIRGEFNWQIRRRKKKNQN